MMRSVGRRLSPWYYAILCDAYKFNFIWSCLQWLQRHLTTMLEQFDTCWLILLFYLYIFMFFWCGAEYIESTTCRIFSELCILYEIICSCEHGNYLEGWYCNNIRNACRVGFGAVIVKYMFVNKCIVRNNDCLSSL